MPLQGQNIDVLFGGGIDRKTAKHVVAQPKLTRLENRVFRGGLLARRPGTKRLYGPGEEDASFGLTQGAMLGTFKGMLVARDVYHLMAWSKELGAFSSRGVDNGQTPPEATAPLSVPPPNSIVSRERIYGSQKHVHSIDIAEADGYQVHSWYTLAPGSNQAFPFATAIDSTGAVMVAASKLNAAGVTISSQNVAIGAARLVSMSGQVGMFYGTATGLRFKSFRPSIYASRFSDEIPLDSTPLLRVDAAPLGDGRAVVAVIQAANNTSTRTVTLYVIGTPGTVDATATVATYVTGNQPGGTQVGTTEMDNVAVGVSADGNVVVAYAVKNGAGHNSIRAAVYSGALSVVTPEAEVLDLVTAFGATAFRTNIAIGKGALTNWVHVVVEFWLEDSPGTSYRSSVAQASFDQDLTNIGGGFSVADDASLLTKPYQLEFNGIVFGIITPAAYSTTSFPAPYQFSPFSSVLVINQRNQAVARLAVGEYAAKLTPERPHGVVEDVLSAQKRATFSYAEVGNKALGEAAVVARVDLVRDTPVREPSARLVPFEHHGSLYFPGEIPRQFDGQNFHEVGFSSPVDNFTVAAGSGTLPAGAYVCAVIAEWTDASGELHQSAPIFKAVVLAGTGGITWTIKDVPKTDKPGVLYALYRTYVSAGVVSATLHRLNDTLGVPGGSVTESEANIQNNPPEYTNGGTIVESVAAPPCGHISEHARRLVLSGTPDGKVWYSPKHVPGIAPRFAEDFTLQPTGQGGKCVATASMDGREYLLCERNVEYVTGDGPDEAFNGAFSDPQVVTLETGCLAPQSVRVTPQGLTFLGERGVYLISRDGSAGYVGDLVSSLTGNPVGIIHMPHTEEIRVPQVGPEPELVYSTAYQQWSSNPGRAASSAALWDGRLVWSDVSAGVTSIYAEDEDAVTDNGSPIASLVETPWLRMANLAGFQRLWWVYLLATYRGASTITLEIGYNESQQYEELVRCFTGDLNLQPGDSIPLRWKPQIQKCRSVRFRVSCDGGGDDPTAGCDLTGLTLSLGVKRGLFKLSQVETLGSAPASGGA